MIYLAFTIISVLVTFFYINIKSKKKNIVIVLGSGGHTAEMIITLKQV